MNILKSWLLVLVAFCFITIEAAGQADKPSPELWDNLQTGWMRRTMIAKQLAAAWPGYKEMDQKVIPDITESAAALEARITAGRFPDSTFVADVQKLDADLKAALEKAFTEIDSNLKHGVDQKLLELQAQLEGAQNRIDVGVRNYNANVRSINRKDLLFKIKDDKGPPRVIFD